MSAEQKALGLSEVPASEVRRTTGIEWTQHTWNPVVGCTIATAGCTNCYAMRMAYRLEHAFHQPAYAGTTKKTSTGAIVWTGKLNRASRQSMRKPETITEPSTIFVNSMSDMFHPDMPDVWRDEAFALMFRIRRHRYQILTKRPEVAVRYYAQRPDLHGLPHIWIGASVERGKEAWRIDELRKVPAGVRFLSVEPLIGALGPVDLTGIHWVITGGESGPGARLCKPEWTREVRDLCQAQGVAYFHKQHGTYRNHPLVVERGMPIAEVEAMDQHGKGGALLDGRLWREMPA